MNGQEIARMAAEAFRKTCPDGRIHEPEDISYLRAQSLILLRSKRAWSVKTGYYLHGLAEAMEARHG